MSGQLADLLRHGAVPTPKPALVSFWVLTELRSARRHSIRVRQVETDGGMATAIRLANPEGNPLIDVVTIPFNSACCPGKYVDAGTLAAFRTRETTVPRLRALGPTNDISPLALCVYAQETGEIVRIMVRAPVRTAEPSSNRFLRYDFSVPISSGKENEIVNVHQIEPLPVQDVPIFPWLAQITKWYATAATIVYRGDSLTDPNGDYLSFRLPITLPAFPLDTTAEIDQRKSATTKELWLACPLSRTAIPMGAQESGEHPVTVFGAWVRTGENDIPLVVLIAAKTVHFIAMDPRGSETRSPWTCLDLKVNRHKNPPEPILVYGALERKVWTDAINRFYMTKRSEESGWKGAIKWLSGSGGCVSLSADKAGPRMLVLMRQLSALCDLDFVTVEDGASVPCAGKVGDSHNIMLRTALTLKDGMTWYGRQGFFPNKAGTGMHLLHEFGKLPWSETSAMFSRLPDTYYLQVAQLVLRMSGEKSPPPTTSFAGVIQWLTTQAPTGLGCVAGGGLIKQIPEVLESQLSVADAKLLAVPLKGISNLIGGTTENIWFRRPYLPGRLFQEAVVS